MFGLILPSRPLLPFTTLSPTQYACAFPPSPHFSHIVVFLLPNTILPPDTAAAVYISFTGPSGSYKLLGALAADKPSAIFKVRNPGEATGGAVPEVDMDADGGPAAGGEIMLGISIEPLAVVVEQLAGLGKGSVDGSADAAGVALAIVPRGGTVPSTKVLAQRIIKNAFNFLASFGNEVVPLKSFQDWWVKFERRVENDPGFLERDEV